MEQHAQKLSSAPGLAYGVTAYTLWGIFPLYFKLLAHVSPLVVVSHRIVWSSLFLALLLSLRREWSCIRPAIRSLRTLLLLFLAAILVGANWLIFIYAVGHGMTLQASLGYFINPLLSVVLGMVFLGERLRRWQWVAVGVAGIAVLNLAIEGSRFPWIALALAGTFGCYGLVRKKVDVNSLHALFIETTVLVPVAAILMCIAPGAMSLDSSTWAILSLSGFVTATPLLFFGAALRRLKLQTVGFLQYIGPTLQFAVAVLVFHEAMDRAKLVSFVLCWIAIAIYVADSLWKNRVNQLTIEEPD